MTPKKPSESIAPVELNPQEETGVATRMTTPGTNAAIGQISGEVSQSDFRTPTLKIIQGTTIKQSQDVEEGMSTIDANAIAEDKDGKCRLTVLSMEKYYKANVKKEGRPVFFQHLDDAFREGYIMPRSKAERENAPRYVEDMAQAQVLIEMPPETNDKNSFPIEIDGKFYALARWFLESTTYRDCAKLIFSKAAFRLKDTGLLSGKWILTTRKVPSMNGEYYAKNLSLETELNPPDFIKKVMDILA